MTQPARSARRDRVDGTLPKPTPDVEVGVGSVSPFSVPFKNAWELLRSDDITVRQLVAMRQTDGQARALYRLMTLPIRAALKTATFIPSQYVDGGDEEAEFCEQMFSLPANAGGMSVPFNRVIAQLLMALFDGFSAFEMVYQSPDDGPLEGKWTIKKLAYRPSETLTFLVDEHSEYDGLRQRTSFQNKQIDVVIPAEHSFYYAANEEERAFYGRSYFESAFYHWDKKFKLYAVAHIAAQRAAVGTRVGKLPKNPSREERERFTQKLAELGVAQYMTIPNDYEVDSLKEAGGFDFLAYVNHHNSQMSKSILAAFFDKEQGGGDSGKLVDFGTQSDALFLLMLQTIMGEIEDVVNQKIVPRFIDWNFGTGKYPRFQFGSLSAEQKSAMLDLFKTVAVAGQSLTITPEFVHEMEVQVAEELGLEIDWETVEARMEQEAEAQQEMAQMQAITSAGITMPGAPNPTDMLVPGAGAPGGNAGAGKSPQGHSSVPPAAVPEGFALTSQRSDGDEPDMLALSEYAAQLLDEAQVLNLVRGRPNAGGPKFVRTAQGAALYGVPIGSPITRDMEEQSAGKEGAKGAAQGRNNAKKGDPAKGKGQQLGGGLGDQGNLGGVVTKTDPGSLQVKAVYTNPKAPGAKLLDFGDGTVAVVDAEGRMSPRQRWNVRAFAQLGWKVDPSAGGLGSAAAGGAAKQGTASATGESARGVASTKRTTA